MCFISVKTCKTKWNIVQFIVYMSYTFLIQSVTYPAIHYKVRALASIHIQSVTFHIQSVTFPALHYKVRVLASIHIQSVTFPALRYKVRALASIHIQSLHILLSGTWSGFSFNTYSILTYSCFYFTCQGFSFNTYTILTYSCFYFILFSFIIYMVFIVCHLHILQYA